VHRDSFATAVENGVLIRSPHAPLSRCFNTYDDQPFRSLAGCGVKLPRDCGSRAARVADEPAAMSDNAAGRGRNRRRITVGFLRGSSLATIKAGAGSGRFLIGTSHRRHCKDSDLKERDKLARRRIMQCGRLSVHSDLPSQWQQEPQDRPLYSVCQSVCPRARPTAALYRVARARRMRSFSRRKRAIEFKSPSHRSPFFWPTCSAHLTLCLNRNAMTQMESSCLVQIKHGVRCF
jgi:hypothetical protein